MTCPKCGTGTIKPKGDVVKNVAYFECDSPDCKKTMSYEEMCLELVKKRGETNVGPGFN